MTIDSDLDVPLLYGKVSRSPSSVSMQSRSSQNSTGNLADVDLFIRYLKRVVVVLLDEADGEVPPELEKTLQEKSNIELLRKYISDFSINVLLVKKSLGIYAHIYGNI